jgi:hypothetical protein
MNLEELVARAIFRAQSFHHPDTESTPGKPNWSLKLDAASAVLSALRDAGALVEPSEVKPPISRRMSENHES